MSKNIKINIKAGVLTISGILFLSVYLNAQPDKKFIRKGNREYRKENYSESEIQYRKAEEKSKRSPDAVFNIGDALYRQKKYDDASKQFLDNANMNEDAFRKASAWYNMGNSLLQAQKVKESIDAYKNSLKLDPANMQAKYNLGYAQDLLKKQEQQQKKDQDQDKEDQKKKDDENKKKDQDKKQDQNDKQQQQQQQQQQQEQTISKEDAQRLLNALANDEKNVQEKVKREKAANARVRISKNW